MIWFKHYTDNHRGRSMQFLFDEMGHTGIACWYILMEMCAEKLEKSLSKEDCVFEFHERILRDNLRLSRTNVRRMLDLCATFAMLSYETDGTFVKIKMPKLAELLHPDLKRARQRPGRIQAASRLDLELELNKEEEVAAVVAPVEIVKQEQHKTVLTKPAWYSTFEAQFEDLSFHEEAMRTFCELQPKLRSTWMFRKKLLEGKAVFPDRDDFYEFLMEIHRSIKSANPNPVGAYAAAIWNKEVVARLGDQRLTVVPSGEGR